MDTLISMGVTVAYGWSVWALFFGTAGQPGMRMGFELVAPRGSAGGQIYLEIAAALTTFILAGRFFEARSKRRAGSALRALLHLGAKDAAVLREGREQRIPIDALGMGLYTLNTGLVRAGSPLTAHAVAQAFGLISDPPTADTVTLTGGRQQAVLTASPGSYSPANIALRAGVPTTLVVHSDGASGCITAFIIQGRQWILPETGDTPIDLGVLQPGQIDFTCAMGMYSGVLTVTQATTRAPPPTS